MSRCRATALLDAAADPTPDRPAGAMQVPIEPDSGRFADQMILRNETPVAAIVTVIAIVADHQVLARRNLDFLPVAVIAQSGRARLDAFVVALQFAVAAGTGRRHDFVRGQTRQRLVAVRPQD